MDQQKRLLVAIALSFGLTLIWTQLVWKPQADAEAAALAAKLDGGVLGADGGTAVLAAAPVEAAPPVAAPVAADLPLREVEVNRATTRLAFTTEGGGLTRAELTGEREREERQLTIVEGWQKLFGAEFSKPPHMNLAHAVPGVGPNLAVSILGSAPVPATQRYAVSEEGPGKVSFVTRSGPWEITKTFTWADEPAKPGNPAGYLSNLAVTVKNVSAVAQVGELGVHALRAILPNSEEAPSLFGGIGNQASSFCEGDGKGFGFFSWRVTDGVKRVMPKEDGERFDSSGVISFFGIDQQYFMTAVWPKKGTISGRCLLMAKPTERGAALFEAISVGPSETLSRDYGVFLGPKELNLLVASGSLTSDAQAYDPHLEKTIDLGIWAFICKILIFFLRFFHTAVGNWGLAIILLTVLVKLVVLPLTHKAMVSAEKMKAMQPKMEEIRKKYPDDQYKQMEEMRKVGIDPIANLTGCLPIFLQLPVWAALFTTLRTSYELYGEPFYGVWSNLTTKDPTYLLPLALGITMIVTQRLQPQMMEKQQAFMMTWIMPIFFTGIMMNYPAGLALYIFTNNLLSIVQQYALRRWLNRGKALTATGVNA
jgi:YidC/Oxa1 family membrane protein insertase